MAIRDKFEEQEKNGMKIVTNMNGEKRANNKLICGRQIPNNYITEKFN